MIETSNILKELEKSILSGKLMIGLNSVIRALKQGNAQKIIYARDAPKEIREEIEYYAKIAETPCIEYDKNSKDLGVACKRTHSVLTAVILKA